MWIGTCDESYIRREDILRFQEIRWGFKPPDIEVNFHEKEFIKDLEITLYGLKALTKDGNEFFIGFSDHENDIKNCIRDILTEDNNELILVSKYNLKFFSNACNSWIHKTYKDYLVKFHLIPFESTDPLLQSETSLRLIENIGKSIGIEERRKIYRSWLEKEDFRYPS